jgi:L-fucose isomerase-like protein
MTEELSPRRLGNLQNRKPKIGFLLFGHPDYPNDVGRKMLEEAAGALKNGGCEAIVKHNPVLSRSEGFATADEIRKDHPDGIVLFLGTWIECPVVMASIRELEEYPFALWGFPQFINQEGKKDSTGSFVALSVLKGTLDRLGYRYTLVAGLPGDEAAIEKAARFSRVAMTIRALRRSAIGLVGYASMGMYPGTFDHALLRRKIGPEVIHIDTSSLIRKMEQVPKEKGENVLKRLASSATIDASAGDEHLAKVARMTVALEELVEEHRLDGLDLKCQYELSQEYGCTGCVALSVLADQGLVAGCEGDIPTTTTQAILSALTGETTTYGDLLDWEDGKALISPCGYAPFSLCANRPTIRDIAHPGFSGLITSSVLKPGTLTLARLAETRGGYRMQVLVGETVKTDLRQGKFPAIRVRLRESLDEILENISGQHFALAYGDRGEDLRELCRYLDVDYVGR